MTPWTIIVANKNNGRCSALAKTRCSIFIQCFMADLRSGCGWHWLIFRSPHFKEYWSATRKIVLACWTELQLMTPVDHLLVSWNYTCNVEGLQLFSYGVCLSLVWMPWGSSTRAAKSWIMWLAVIILWQGSLAVLIYENLQNPTNFQNPAWHIVYRSPDTGWRHV